MPELIDRQTLKNHLYRAQAEAFKRSEWYVAGSIQSFIDILDNQPTIEPEVRRGHWIAVSSFDACGGDEEAWMAHGNPTAYHYCSECKNETYVNEEGKEILSDYCPFCGADMREEGADNDSE